MKQREQRGFLQTIFRGKGKTAAMRPAETAVGRSAFYPWSGNAFDSDIARAAISQNAAHIAKLQPRHIRREGERVTAFPDPAFKRLLRRPNPLMGMYDLLYKAAAQREEYGNGFIYVHWEAGALAGLYPISQPNVNLLETEDGALFLQVSLGSGKQVVLPYNEVIHLRKHFSHDDVFGAGSVRPLDAPLQVLHATDQGMVKAIKRGAHLRGLLEFSQVLQREDVKQLAQEFVEDFLTLDNDGGVAAADPRYTYKELEPKGYVPNKLQMDFARDRIHSYYGTNDTIIQSRFTETQWDAFYESVVEPVAIQLSEEFTEKLFTPTERAQGNEILFEANRLQYASVSTKLGMTKLVELGLMTRNEYRGILNMPPVKDGDKLIVSLNYIDADKADEYQTGKKEGEEHAAGQGAGGPA